MFTYYFSYYQCPQSQLGYLFIFYCFFSFGLSFSFIRNWFNARPWTFSMRNKVNMILERKQYNIESRTIENNRELRTTNKRHKQIHSLHFKGISTLTVYICIIFTVWVIITVESLILSWNSKNHQRCSLNTTTFMKLYLSE